MEKLINDSIIPIINQGNLSIKKIYDLIDLKKFINRIASKNYIINDTLHSLKEKYGEEPNIISWGDYFQSEIATTACSKTDQELTRIISTIKFDIISAYEIFSNNDEKFVEWVELSNTKIITEKNENFTESENEILHLKILKDYYYNMGIINNFNAEDRLWYNSFFTEEAIIS